MQLFIVLAPVHVDSQSDQGLRILVSDQHFEVFFGFFKLLFSSLGN